jgi:hypothetical protein
MKQTADVLVVATTILSYGFLARYLMTTWFRTTAGRIMMSLVVVVFLIFTMASLTVVLGQDFPFRQPLRVVTYGLTTALGSWALFILYTDQRRIRKRARQRDEQA